MNPVTAVELGAIAALTPVVAIAIHRLWRSAVMPITEDHLLGNREVSHGTWEHHELKLIPHGDWPKGPQVYAQFNPDQECVYVGQAVDLKQRFNGHAGTERAFLHQWTTWKAWACEARELNYVERSLIRLWQPIGNVQKYRTTIPERPAVA